LQDLVRHGFEPDDATVGTLVNVSLQESRPEIAEWLSGYMQESHDLGSTIMCSHFLKLLTKSSRLHDALALYSKMKRSTNSKPDIIVYSMMIKACIGARALDNALSILEDLMESKSCGPDDIILTHILEGCRQAGKFEQGTKIFERLVTLGVAPSECTILTLLKLYGSAGDQDAAYEVVASCQESYGRTPSIIHYTCLMSGALRSRKYDSAWSAYMLMQQQGVRPDTTAVTTLLPGMVVSQNWDRVTELVTTVLKLSPPLGLPTEMLNNALSQMVGAGASDHHVMRLRLSLQRAGIPITVRKLASVH
jgi:pentatricopeptide repeat protein